MNTETDQTMSQPFQSAHPSSDASARDSASNDAFPDRRQALDRRGSGRQGKYDRRRNRCGHCRFFVKEPQGFCQQHQIALEAEDFACPLFASVLPLA